MNTTEYEPLAQSAEHLPFKQGVRSSNLRWLTRKSLFIGYLVGDGDFAFSLKPQSCVEIC